MMDTYWSTWWMTGCRFLFLSLHFSFICFCLTFRSTFRKYPNSNNLKYVIFQLIFYLRPVKLHASIFKPLIQMKFHHLSGKSSFDAQSPPFHIFHPSSRKISLLPSNLKTSQHQDPGRLIESFECKSKFSWKMSNISAFQIEKSFQCPILTIIPVMTLCSDTDISTIMVIYVPHYLDFWSHHYSNNVFQSHDDNLDFHCV